MIKEHLEKVLSFYLKEKTLDFSGNYLAGILRNGVVNGLHKLANLPPGYLLQGSPGFGSWAEVPWVGVFDKDITESAQRGYYVVYLFNAQMNGVYLSLNQGWTQFAERFGVNEARARIQESTGKFRELVRYVGTDYSLDAISLQATGGLGTGYELGHICGRFYPRDQIPGDKTIVRDLEKMVDVYRKVKDIVGNDISNINLLYGDTDKERPAARLKERIDVGRRFARLETEEEIMGELNKLETELSRLGPRKQSRVVQAIERNPKVAELIKLRAKYQCEICGFRGFSKKDGGLYAVAHHKEALCDLGRDSPSNIICVCPTCHAVIHHGTEEALQERKELK